MYKDQKVIVVMPAYNAAKTLRRTWDEVMAQEIADLVIVVDDGSHDETVSIAEELPNTLLPSRVNVPAEMCQPRPYRPEQPGN